MLDALYPVYYALENVKVECRIDMETLVQAAKDGAEKPSDLESRAGRSRYVQEKGARMIDPGVFAVYLLLKGILDSRQ